MWKLWYILFVRIHRWIESSKEQLLFETEIFCNIINVFTVTFDQYNASFMNKSIKLIKIKKITDPKVPHFWEKQNIKQEVMWVEHYIIQQDLIRLWS